jgi:hypothetical protein
MSLRPSWSPADLNLPMRWICGSTPTFSSTPRRKVPDTATPLSEMYADGGTYTSSHAAAR